MVVHVQGAGIRKQRSTHRGYKLVNQILSWFRCVHRFEHCAAANEVATIDFFELLHTLVQSYEQ